MRRLPSDFGSSALARRTDCQEPIEPSGVLFGVFIMDISLALT